MARVLVAGCGYVGTALGLRLSAEGHDVWGLRRDASGLPAPLRGVSADLTDPAGLRALPDEIELVAYTAAPASGDDDAYARAYVAGTAALLAFLARRGDPVRRFLLTTSTGVYAQSAGERVDETSETAPTHHTGRRMLQGERVVREGPFPAVALRLGGIYGPGREGLVDAVRAGRARVPPSPVWSNRIHRDDCAGAAAHLLALERPDPVYLGVDDEPADLGAVYRWLAARLGLPEPPPEDAGAPAATGRRARTNKRCANARLRAAGYAFAYPTFREGYAELAAPR